MNKYGSHKLSAAVFVAMSLALIAVALSLKDYSVQISIEPATDDQITTPTTEVPQAEDTTTKVEVYDPSDPPQLILFSASPISGNNSYIFELNETDYQTSLATDKFVLLYFTSNTCAGCSAELNTVKTVFDELEHDDLVGFVIHLDDDQTTDLGDLLAQQLGVTEHRTKVILKKGVKIIKSVESWNVNRYLEEVRDLIPSQP